MELRSNGKLKDGEKALFRCLDKDLVVTSDGKDLQVPPGMAELPFDEEEDLEGWTGCTDFVPALGLQKWDGHIYLCGATGSGKTFMIKKMLGADKQRRKIYLFTDHQRQDPSLKELYDSGRLKMVVRVKNSNHKWQVDYGQMYRGLKGSIVVFDDATEQEILDFRDQILRQGRHKNVMAVTVNHKMRDNAATKHMWTNCRFVVCFPGANRGEVMGFLGRNLEIQPKARRRIIRQAIDDGRHMIFHMQAPNAIATAQSIIRL